ncbi:hypothetical protein ACO0LM_12075 [Undibacterium sp. Di26W]|uniref:hypothetical protein n=1 Tax=Undibacterium sp. Di26W TaxID=3413035 RepID=UPI003BF29916
MDRVIIGGLIIISSPYVKDVPRMTLSPKVTVTPEFRAEMNAWMLEFFGTEQTGLEFTDPATGIKTVILSEEAYAALIRNALSTQPFPMPGQMVTPVRNTPNRYRVKMPWEYEWGSKSMFKHPRNVLRISIT